MEALFLIKDIMKTHKVIDLTYTVEEGQDTFAGTEIECSQFVYAQGDFGYEVIPMTLEEINLYKETEVNERHISKPR